MPSLIGASTLYDAGTQALARGEVGPSVLFLTAAARLEPRAADIARNASIAEARVALARGEMDAVASRGFAPPLSAGEGWWIAALLLACGAAGMAFRAHRTRPLAHPRGRSLPLRVLDLAGGIGLAVAVTLAIAAGVERAMPEAVVVEPKVALTAASGQPLPGEPALVSGERVRLGPEREGLVEVRLEGTVVGWARRAAFWRVRDAARYTSGFTSAEGPESGGRGSADE
ncbi:MAG TPA: hypothetical protein VLT84_06780 [Acidobacteriota bacterium]|nr:hypothetical protein [Acidobacteriota bacterium]